MTADEFRTILDRFHEALGDADMWIVEHLDHDEDEGYPEFYAKCDQVWRDLNRECALMKDAERRLITSKHPRMVQPTRPLPDPPLKPSEVNAEAIGELQAKVAQLEGETKALREAISPVVQVSPPHCHEDNGLRCLVAHGDGKGNQQPPCMMCKRCGEYIRPEAMGQSCPGKSATKGNGWSDSKPPEPDDTAVLADGSVPG